MEIERRILLGCLAPVRIPHAFRADRRTRFFMDLIIQYGQKRETKKEQNGHTSSCVDPLVSIYLFLTSLISMSLWNAASSLRTPDANWAAILAAMAAAAAAASDALLTSFVELGGVGLSSFVEAGWSHLLLEVI